MEIPLVSLLVEHGFTPSRADARRLIAQGAVRLGGKRILDVNHSVPSGRMFHSIKVGKTMHKTVMT